MPDSQPNQPAGRILCDGPCCFLKLCSLPRLLLQAKQAQAASTLQVATAAAAAGASGSFPMQPAQQLYGLQAVSLVPSTQGGCAGPHVPQTPFYLAPHCQQAAELGDAGSRLAGSMRAAAARCCSSVCMRGRASPVLHACAWFTDTVAAVLEQQCAVAQLACDSQP